ncbi:uncharacterized protein DUF3151 [Antricoccus suffuscus]|uniref:Uncharacterized protein DUF3151 n=2 Tax=Antricoccus suffuscus TaxID=1629062 RepID=A0A2T1A1T1_9ACTN|nr:uncharacterized protein DUF3151 [Antricoccus suffuscus]
MAQPPSTKLTDNPDAARRLTGGDDPAEVAASYPTYSAAWATLAERAIADGRVIEAYAYARTGYHRGLDALRRSGWKGFGAVPWNHEPNRGVLRCFFVLANAAQQIGETEEYDRLIQLLNDSDPEALAALQAK